MPTQQASADELAFQARIHQQFTPNTSAELDLVFTDVPVDLSAAERARDEAAKAAEAAAKEAAEAAEAARAAGPPKYTGGGSMAEWMAAAGIAESDWSYVYYIAERESSLNPNATNASTGACGLIQAYPCSKVPGNGYDPIDNLRWASGYASGRYGGWAQAYDFWTANHWW
ncbi:aggregation-promoting factor C-terminal-like domain-containing protein [Leucobacter sp. HY1910]